MKNKFRIFICLVAYLLCSFACVNASSRNEYGKRLDLNPAKWIWYPSTRTLQNTFVLFRKDIVLNELPQQAKGWIIADSRYKIFVNGERVQWGPAPSDPRWQEADPLDIKKYLKKGTNTIAVEVCFFGSGDGTTPFGKPGLLVNLDIDGMNIVSDASWKCSLARSWEPGKFKRWFLRSLQECFDARLYPYGWDKADYVMGEDWLPAKILGPGNRPSMANGYRDYIWEARNGNRTVEIRERTVPMMKETFVKNPSLKESMVIDWKVPAENFFDMAMDDKAYEVQDRVLYKENVNDSVFIIEPQGDKTVSYIFAYDEQGVGFPFFTIDAPEGTIVEMLVHEAHEQGGPAIINSHFHSWSRLICKEGINTFETFDFESYRWVQLLVRNFDRPVKISNIGMRRRVYPWSVTPNIVVKDDTLQHVLNASINTLNNCAQETLVDGMARERQQYSGDGSHQLHAVYQFLKSDSLVGRYINTFSQGSSLEGYFMDSWPGWDRLVRVFERQVQMTAWGPILDHSVGFCFDTYHYYMYTGNKDYLTEVFPRLIKFYQYMKTLTHPTEKLIPAEDIGICSVYIDHLSYKQNKHKELALNLYVAAMCKNALAPLCVLFERPDLEQDVLAYGKMLEENCIRKFWDKEQKVFVANMPWRAEEGEDRYCDRSLSVALMYNLCPNGETEKSLDILVNCPSNLGSSYPCNIVWPVWALAKYRRMDKVIEHLRTQWGQMRSVWENNTLQEFFDAKPDNTSQWSHCAVAPLIALSQGVAGISPLKADGSLIKIEPQVADLEQVEFDVYTQRGFVHFFSKGKLGNRTVIIDMPNNVSAEIWLDEREKVNLPLLRTEANGIKVYLLENTKKLKLKLKHS